MEIKDLAELFGRTVSSRVNQSDISEVFVMPDSFCREGSIYECTDGYTCGYVGFICDGFVCQKNFTCTSFPCGSLYFSC